MKTQHVCDFLTLTAAMSIWEMERLAGVCDRDTLYSAAARAIRDPAEQMGEADACAQAAHPSAL